jgi:hypothetical protein
VRVEVAGALEPSPNRPRFSGGVTFAGKGADAHRRCLPLEGCDNSRRGCHGLHAVAAVRLALSTSSQIGRGRRGYAQLPQGRDDDARSLCRHCVVQVIRDQMVDR